MLLKRAYPEGAVSVPEGGSTRDDVAPGAGVPVVRRGAEFLGGSTGVVQTSFAPTSPDVSFEWTMAVGAATGGERIMGRFQSGRVYFLRTAGNSLVIYEQGNGFASFVDTVIADGEPHQYRINLGVNTQELLVDGVVVEQKTGTFSMATGGADFYIGNYAATGSGLNGTVWDVSLINHADAERSSFFALDTLDASGNYPNTHPGSTVGDATVTGTVLQPTVATTTPGSGVPLATTPVVFMASRTTPFNVGPGSGGTSIDLNTGPQVDPYGWRTSSANIDLPVAGVGVFQVTGRIRATTLAAASTPTFRLFEQVPGNIERAQLQLTFDTLNEWVPYALTVAINVAAGSSYRWQIVGINTLNGFEIDDTYLTLTLYPELG